MCLGAISGLQTSIVAYFTAKYWTNQRFSKITYFL